MCTYSRYRYMTYASAPCQRCAFEIFIIVISTRSDTPTHLWPLYRAKMQRQDPFVFSTGSTTTWALFLDFLPQIWMLAKLCEVCIDLALVVGCLPTHGSTIGQCGTSTICSTNDNCNTNSNPFLWNLWPSFDNVYCFLLVILGPVLSQVRVSGKVLVMNWFIIFFCALILTTSSLLFVNRYENSNILFSW